ncbi:MAG: sirohydrochlorin nickelochelatase [Methanomicrobiaceae archaeon]|nr:sirohydrochlorin nickelochelatase [Methanomicrobiaceae archaeon]
MTKIGFLLVGHGSKKPYNKQLIDNTAKIIAEKEEGYVVKTGFMEFNEPTIPEALEAFRDEDIEILQVVPLFLARGMHIDKDIPDILGIEEGGHRGTFKLKDKEIPLVFADPIGENELLADLMIANGKKSVSDYL